MSFPVFFDTCVLYGELMCDLFLRLAEERIYEPYWSQDVLRELEFNLAKRIGLERTRKRIENMQHAFPDALVSGYKELISRMTCDKKDRHVLAAADYPPAQTLVTFNLKDFPEESTKCLGIEVKHPDDFLLDALNLKSDVIVKQCRDALDNYCKYPQTPKSYCNFLSRQTPHFAKELYSKLCSADAV